VPNGRGTAEEQCNKSAIQNLPTFPGSWRLNFRAISHLVRTVSAMMMKAVDMSSKLGTRPLDCVNMTSACFSWFLNPQDIQQCVRREVGPRRATFVPEETMKASKIYEGFIRFEERSATLYLELSVRFFDNRDLSWFWVEMAMEEKQHAGMLQHCCEAGVFASELPDKGEIQRLNSLFRQLETRLAEPKLTLDDAFDMAIELESSEINDIYSRLTAGIQGPAYIMRKKMELSLAGHFDRLQAAASQFNASRNIQARLAELLSHCGSANPGFRVS
jgi:rubrerythrin